MFGGEIFVIEWVCCGVVGRDGCGGVEGVSRERGVVMHKSDDNIWDAREQELLKQNAKGESESMGC